MVAMLNKLTGTKMYVAEDRVLEYKAMGHTLYEAKPVRPIEKIEIADKGPIPAKRTKKKDLKNGLRKSK